MDSFQAKYLVMICNTVATNVVTMLATCCRCGLLVQHQSLAAPRFVQRNEASEKAQQALSLPESFAPGQLVVAVILTAQQVGPQRVRLDASLRPSLVNAGLTAEQLRSNMWLSTAVVGEEEHVLRLDFGVENLTGIIKKTEYGEEPVPKVGSIVMVSVQKVNSQAGTVKCSLASSEPIGNDPLDHSSLKAGMLVSARVRSVVEAKPRQTPGLQVRFCGLTAVIHKHHDGETGETEEVEWTKNQKLIARILAVLPETTPVIQLTLLPHLVEWAPQDLSQKAQIGELLVGNILDFQPKYGCRVHKLQAADADSDGDVLGFCSMSRLADTDKDIVATSVKPGFQSQYRVLSYNFLDNLLILTRKPADLEDGVLVSVSELSPGQLVTGIVTNVADHGRPGCAILFFPCFHPVLAGFPICKGKASHDLSLAQNHTYHYVCTYGKDQQFVFSACTKLFLSFLSLGNYPHVLSHFCFS